VATNPPVQTPEQMIETWDLWKGTKLTNPLKPSNGGNSAQFDLDKYTAAYVESTVGFPFARPYLEHWAKFRNLKGVDPELVTAAIGTHVMPVQWKRLRKFFKAHDQFAPIVFERFLSELESRIALDPPQYPLPEDEEAKAATPDQVSAAIAQQVSHEVDSRNGAIKTH
jgi:hypothetical protein